LTAGCANQITYRLVSLLLSVNDISLLVTYRDGKIDLNRFESIHQAESISIDSHCRIVMKNFDSVPQLQLFSYVHHCAARSRHGSHSRATAKAISSSVACGPAMASVDSCILLWSWWGGPDGIEA